MIEMLKYHVLTNESSENFYKTLAWVGVGGRESKRKPWKFFPSVYDFPVPFLLHQERLNLLQSKSEPRRATHVPVRVRSGK